MPIYSGPWIWMPFPARMYESNLVYKLLYLPTNKVYHYDSFIYFKKYFLNHMNALEKHLSIRILSIVRMTPA